MTTPLHSRTSGLLPAALRLVAAAGLVCLLSQGLLAQDNDDDGVLPVTGGSSEGEGTNPGGGGTSSGSSGNEGVSVQSDVLVAGELQDELDPARATIQLDGTQGSTGLVSEASAEEATFVADPPVFAAGETGSGQALQASGQLHLQEGLQARFVPAQLASKSVALLLLAHDGPTLAAEAGGATKPELVIPLGAAVEIDVNKLAAITEKYADVLPGYHATVLFVSAQAGELHVAAVRTHTEGGPVDVLVR
jgi:hypothetical protein